MKKKIYIIFIKRLLDIFLSLSLIILLSPIFIILTLLGFIFMNGKPFFCQPRVGKIKNGHETIFKILKFKTMNDKKDENGVLLPSKERITAYGRFLRKTSLDEICQLFNIFIGQMSFVGPRPLLVKYLNLYSAEERNRHLVKPGLTGYAQISLVEGDWKEKFRLDLEYIRKISFCFDLKIFFKTFIIVFKKIAIKSRKKENEIEDEFIGKI